MSTELPLRILSFGAGFQSSALYIMAARKEIKVDRVVFADTGDEPDYVYGWMEWLEFKFKLPITIVSGGDIVRDSLEKKFITAPFYTQDEKGVLNMLPRQCTNQYKIQPIYKYIRGLGVTRKNPVKLLMGITTDEAHRMKPARVRYVENIYPFIDMGWHRGMTKEYVIKHTGETPPKSACRICPYRDDAGWIEMKKNHPQIFEEVCDFEMKLQAVNERLVNPPFIHGSLTPLWKAQFRNQDQLSLFGNECEGMCGV